MFVLALVVRSVGWSGHFEVNFEVKEMFIIIFPRLNYDFQMSVLIFRKVNISSTVSNNAEMAEMSFNKHN